MFKPDLQSSSKNPSPEKFVDHRLSAQERKLNLEQFLPDSGPAAMGLLVFQDERLVFSNPSAQRLLGLPSKTVRRITLAGFVETISREDQDRVLNTLSATLSGQFAPILTNVQILHPNDSNSWVDMMVNLITYQGSSAVQIYLFDITAQKRTQESLIQQVKRLQIVRDIQFSILAAQDERNTAATALLSMRSLIAGYTFGLVAIYDSSKERVELLAGDYVDPNFANTQSRIQELIPSPEYWADGNQTLSITLDSDNPENSRYYNHTGSGILSILAVPIQSKDEITGCLLLTTDQHETFKDDQVQMAHDVADALAVAVQQSRLKKLESQRQKEAQWMHEVMASLARAANLQQSLEIILVNLRSVIHYDRAGLFLLDDDRPEDSASTMRLGIGLSSGTHTSIYPNLDPVVAEMVRTRLPMLVDDVQADDRFLGWPDMDSVHSWMGIPLLAGEEMIGFVSIGSLEQGTYSVADADMIQDFTNQVAEVIHKAWIQEKTHRKTEELEVLSDITFALGQAETHEDTLAAIISQVGHFLGANCGTYLILDEPARLFRVKYSQDDQLIGLQHPDGTDLLWRVILAKNSAVIPDCLAYLEREPGGIFPALLSSQKSAALIPLIAAGTPFGVLCLSYDQPMNFRAEDITLFNTIAEIAGTSIRRVDVLAALEGQVSQRTQHLATLYNINAIATEQIDLSLILSEVIGTTIRAFRGEAGSIHLINPVDQSIRLVAQKNLPKGLFPYFQVLHIQDRFWQELVDSDSPWLNLDCAPSSALPEEVCAVMKGLRTCLITPIRSKNREIGLLTVFGNREDNYFPEEITLFQTIADQIGMYVERARLIEQAEKAAVMQERQRLARELHDSVTQLLYSQVLFSGAGLKVLKQGNLSLLEQHLSRIENVARQALKEMRLLVYELRPYDFLEEGLVTALQRRLDSVEKRSDIQAQLEVEGEFDLDEYQEMALYLIAQEALNNTLKHAGANSVIVRIKSTDHQVILEVEDNGCGFDLDQHIKGGGMGLANMLERAAALGGNMRLLTSPGNGTRVIVQIEARE